MSEVFLLLGGNNQNRQKKLLEFYLKNRHGGDLDHDPDTRILSGESSIKIENVRELQHFLSLKPYLSSPKIALIPQAEKLTLEAQGALLKLLEEPPGETIIIMTVSDQNQLLPTIISRCQKNFLATENESIFDKIEIEEAKKILKEIIKGDPGQRIKIVEKITSKEEAIIFCEKQIIIWREILLEKQTLKEIRIIKLLQKGLKYLKANVNFRLTLENLLLSYPQNADSFE